MYSLYVKTHNETGLKYLGQTVSNPAKYLGSGKDWKIHLKKFGKEHTTEVLTQTNSWEELVSWGKYYSKLYNVVNSVDDYGNKIWANRIPETGGGGWDFVNKNKLGDRRGTKLTEAQRKNVSVGKLASITDEYRQIKAEGATGSKNGNYDSNIYLFEQKDFSQRFIGTRTEFLKFSGLKSSTISNLITGIRHSYKGWIFKGITRD